MGKNRPVGWKPGSRTRLEQLFKKLGILQVLIDTQEGRGLINEVAYRIVSEHAPKERPLYVGIRDRYFADPEQFLESSESVENPLDAGEIIALVTLTEVVFPVVVSILSYVAIEVGKALTGKVSGELSQEAIQWTKSLFSEPVKKPLFTQAQLEAIAKTIKEITQSEASAQGIELTKATTVSDSVIAILALAKK